jgi:exonuclease VII small subunit
MKRILALVAVFALAFCLVGCDNEPVKTDKDYYNEYINLESTQAFLNDFNDAYNDCMDAYKTDDLEKTKEARDRVSAIVDKVEANENVPDVCKDLNRYAKRVCENTLESADHMVASVKAYTNDDSETMLQETQAALSANNLASQDVDAFNKEHEDLKLKYED